MSRSGPKNPATEPVPWDDPLQSAVWRLRSRGCWEDAAALLASSAVTESAAALGRTTILVERCLFTATGWEEADDALRAAEALVTGDEERGSAACERGHLAYASTLFGVRDRADEARSALGRAAALLPPGSPNRPLLDFRRGLVAQHLAGDPRGAQAAFTRAHAGASTLGDELLLSFTWRHLASMAEQEGNRAEARHGFAESLRIREELGYLIGIAPALSALADIEPEPDASRLRAEALRLVRLLGGVPSWLADRLRPAGAAAAVETPEAAVSGDAAPSAETADLAVAAPAGEAAAPAATATTTAPRGPSGPDPPRPD
ncbi:hypothetical protein [Streptomyces sp. MNU89]|uniref:hypothetical protein n=1 Tax=Streptomyces sp. MNU89 TaxID=2560025 RepID=UPI001E3B4B97|nr:hypothetical protein [Streptomyces sp. MNU89]MCC9738810.1 hypothetical protein [Streptomyces sp. MNU89]